MIQALSLYQNNPMQTWRNAMLIQHPVDSRREASDMLARIAIMM